MRATLPSSVQFIRSSTSLQPPVVSDQTDTNSRVRGQDTQPVLTPQLPLTLVYNGRLLGQNHRQ